jgi:hypothetical protein
MKIVSINTRVLAIALAASFAVAFTTPALATEEKKAIPVELKFIGSIKEQPLFHLVFTGTEENEFTIVVRDEFGQILYKDKVKGTSFTKKFLLNIDELGDTEVKFEITGKNFEKPVVFEINKQSRLVEDLVVNKVK